MRVLSVGWEEELGRCSFRAQDWSWKHPLSLGSGGNLLTINMSIMVNAS